MEKEGLHRVMEFLKSELLTIDTIVTDRHRQINKWLRDNHSEVKHFYDIWHVRSCSLSWILVTPL